MQINGKPVVYLKGVEADPIVGQGMYGFAHGHPNHENGQYVRTSPVVRVNGNEVETENTVYIIHVPA